MAIRFAHIRKFTDDGEVLAKGGMTVAWDWAKVGPTRNSFITVATSVCSDKDVYNKKTGIGYCHQAFADGKTIKIPFPRNVQKRCTATELVLSVFGGYFDVSYFRGLINE